MRWLTISEIKRRSKTAKGALKVSYEHWNQLYTATAKELRKKYKETDREIIDADYCGLCNYRRIASNIDSCRQCIFGDYCPYGIYQVAAENLQGWYEKDGNWYDWKRACKAVRDKLKELMD